MRRLALKACVLLPIMIGIVATNYVADPARLFSDDSYEQGLATLWLRGENAANVVAYDERLAQKRYIAGLRQPKQIVAMGSSRALQIRSQLFGGYSFFNNGVNGASLEDFIAIYQLYRSWGLKPEAVILDLDPWLLNRNNGLPYWGTLAEEYSEAVRGWGVSAPPPLLAQRLWLTRRSELFSPSYFQNSIKALAANNEGYYATRATSSSDVNIRLSDGSLVYSSDYTDRPADVVRLAAIAYADIDPVYGLGNFRELDPELGDLFKVFVRSMKQDGVRVVFLLPPYHPEAYTRLIQSNQYKIIVKAQGFFTNFAAQENITTLGSYDPAEAGCDEGDFIDGMHPDEGCMGKIFGPAALFK